MPTRATDRFQQAVVEASDESEWIVRLSRTTAAAAAAEQADAFTRMLSKRVPFVVPVAEGRLTLSDHNLVMVHERPDGAPMTWRRLTGSSGSAGRTRGTEAVALGRAIAALHDVDPRVADEAGIPSYDADGYRSRRLAILDRAAGTGLVPSALLARWERALEEVSLWRFPTCLTHGPIEGQDVFWNAASGRIVAIAGWENAAVADPADDFAAIWALAPPEAFDTVLETYSASRDEAPDKHLERRVRLSAELHRVTVLLDAVAADDDHLIDRRAASLRRLNEQAIDDDGLLPRPPRAARSVAAGADTDNAETDDASEGLQGAVVDDPAHSPDFDRDSLAGELEEGSENRADTGVNSDIDGSGDAHRVAVAADEQHLREDDTVEIELRTPKGSGSER